MPTRFRATVIAAGALTVAALGGGVVATGVTGSQEVSAAPGGEPANLGQVKNQVQDYYGDTVDSGGHHHASYRSRWARDVNRQVAQAHADIAAELARGVQNPAVTLDIDDTSELTYGFNADHDFAHDTKANRDAIRRGAFPAMKQTRGLVRWAKQRGVKVYFITGRKDFLTDATAAGLAKHGYPKPDGLYLEPTKHAPDYLPCGTECSTIEYKSGTRAHLEQQGNTILANLGDQFSDLKGGHAKHAYKLPNPMYYLP